MRQKLVSILTPCHNGGKYIHNLLDSVLDQSYPEIEMFVIDDGSTDNSADIIRSYIPKFTEKGYTLEYNYQKNQGQSVALNKGLKLANGEYLVWPDADDYYSDKNAIAEMVSALEPSDDGTSMVREFNIMFWMKTELQLIGWGLMRRRDIKQTFLKTVYLVTVFGFGELREDIWQRCLH